MKAPSFAHIVIDGQDRQLIKEPDVMALAGPIHAAIPEVPLKGCDLLREEGTGKLFVIEANCRGNTWHFSSTHLAESRKKMGPEYELQRRRQFDAMRTAARVLVVRTNAEAT
ncbi:MAG: hypothetical protein WDM84_08965 [Bauldia sp.]